MMTSILIASLLFLIPASSQADVPAIVDDGPVYTLKTLKKLDKKELRALFEGASLGVLPTDKVRGTVVRKNLNNPITRGLLNTLWSGKQFYAQEGAWEEIEQERFFIESTLHNIVLGHKMFKGQVYRSTSWLDGKPCWVIDYRKTASTIGYIRDEFRHIGQGLFLGWTFDMTPNDEGVRGKRFMLNFAIDTKPSPKKN